ncbi:MAG: hypothetical protein ACFFC7_31075 [Candidatus Hermodarchaeota archaeon]
MGASNNDMAKILEILASLERKVDLLTEKFNQILSSEIPLDVFDVIDRRKELHDGKSPEEVVEGLPEHLRKTYQNLAEVGCADAQTLSDLQWGDEKDKRAVASDHLNQLSVLGLVKKTRLFRKVIFYTTEEDDPTPIKEFIEILKNKSKLCTAEEISLLTDKNINEVEKWLKRAAALGFIERTQIGGTDRNLYSYPVKKSAEDKPVISSTGS